MLKDLNSPKNLRWEAKQIKRAKRGDRRAFAALYDAFAEPLYARVLFPRLGEAAAAEDALAETFRVAFEQLDRFEFQGASLWFWLARVARNKATDIHRARQRGAHAVARYDDLWGPLRDEPELPSAQLERDEEGARLREAMNQALSQINPRYRRVIELRFLEDKPREACAAALEIKLGTLDVLMLRALRALRKAWDGRGGGEA
ncbi:sigma-70 family RNA polymerase sigma factor [Myxococcota bacterium]|nr:sigma-70 family RNA polymerase sigma factor [Myxococcota bacterium]MBU1429722.1 sigma-70 family RNA polymerase sigma factor [Myxococcota bacterium]MBU1898325.1 sigma-70 family RNA polymerase sigma factor [Myxococcota bacterium]